MIVTEAQELTQVRLAEVFPSPEIEAEKKALEKQLRDVDFQFRFDNRNTTAFGSFALVEAFKRAVGFRKIIEEEFEKPKGTNSVYSSADLLEFLVDANILGASRFTHSETLRRDPGYHKVRGIDRFPDERTLRRMIYELTPVHMQDLLAINRRLLDAKSRTEEPRFIWLDIDDTTITLFGKQGEGFVGYNPRYLGRPSYNSRVAFVGGSDEIIHQDLSPGDVRGTQGFEEYFIDCEHALPHNWVIRGVRSDAGFSSDDTFSFLEDRQLLYACKVKKSPRLQSCIEYLDRMDMWQGLDDDYQVAELCIPLSDWEKSRRFVFIREEYDQQTGQKMVRGLKHQVICTNLEDSPEEIWRFYNQRCTVENRIDELKDGFAVGQQSQRTLSQNQAYAMIKVIAYNLLNWKKATVMPEEVKTYRAKTLRRKILCVPGNVVVSGGYIRLAANRWLESVVLRIKQKLDAFLYIIAAHLWPQRA